jgi:hypothetical protein
MSLKKTVGYGPLIEPMIEEKIMKLANEKKTKPTPHPDSNKYKNH